MTHGRHHERNEELDSRECAPMRVDVSLYGVGDVLPVALRPIIGMTRCVRID